MSTSVTFNGSSYTIPAVGDASWGSNVSSYLIALSTGSLQKTAGAFTLTADANFGATYGLISSYFKSYSSTIAQSGIVRLANTDAIAWRNAANSADLLLDVNGSNQLTFGAATIIGTTGTLTANYPVITDSSGSLATEQFLARVRGGTGADMSSVTFPASGVLTTNAGTQTLTNKTFDATSTLTGVVMASFSPDGSHTVTVPATTDTLVNLAGVQTLTNKTLTLPNIATLTPDAGTHTITFPAATDTVATLAAAQTFTNKIYNGGTASASSYLKVPSATLSVLTALTRVAGNIYYATDTKYFYLDDGTNLIVQTQGAAFANPMSAVGDTIYGGTAGAATRLVGNTTTTQQILAQTGTGSASQAPSWVTPKAPTQTLFLQPYNYTFTVSSANATVGATYTNNAQTFTVLYTIAAGTTLVCSATSSTAPTASGTLTKASGTGDATITFSSRVATGTYYTPAGCTWLRVRAAGGGGGGGQGGSGTTSVATAGGNTTFGSSLVTCNGGALGTFGGSTGGAGGSSSLTSSASVYGFSYVGGAGGANPVGLSSGTTAGGYGGVNAFGGGGATVYNGTGGAGITNTGGGGAGAGTNSTGTAGGGGGAGGYVEAFITAPSATYSFAVGTAGVGGVGSGTGANTGGAGGTGIIIVEEHYI